MFYPRLLQILPFLVLSAMANSAPLPNPSCPSCPTLSPPSVLQTRAGPDPERFLPEIQSWTEEQAKAYHAFTSAVEEQKRLFGFQHVSQLDRLPTADRERFQQLKSVADQALQNMNQAQKKAEHFAHQYRLEQIWAAHVAADEQRVAFYQRL